MKRWIALMALMSGGVHAAEVRVTVGGQIEANGADMRVFRGDAKAPLFGRVAHVEDVVRFMPALPLAAGEVYRVEVQASRGSWSIHSLLIPKSKSEAPTVSMLGSDAAYPANTLKFYLQFSQPMEQGVFLDRVTLHRGDGSLVSGAFRETELWTPDGRRLTLWLHPGRQKTGVNLNTDEGPVLVQGEKHTLRIAASWRSVGGISLGQDFAFPIQVAAADHQCPQPQRWRVTTPKRDTREALHILFDESLDPAMLQSALQVCMGDRALKGDIHLPQDAKSWSFRPEEPWPPGRYEISIDPLLEDLAGNNLQHVFELDRQQAASPKALTTSLPFVVQ